MTIQRVRMTIWAPAGAPLPPVPIKTVDVACYHCKRTTRFIPDTIIDSEVDLWLVRYERLMQALELETEVFNQTHGDTPMQARWRETMTRLFSLIQAMHETPPPDMSDY